MAGTSPPETRTLQTCSQYTHYRQLLYSFTKRRESDRDLGASMNSQRGGPKGSSETWPQSRFRPSLVMGSPLRGFIPSVYAADTVVPETPTVSEKVATSRPKVHISDHEVEHFLANETGMDRLRDMFKKGKNDDLSPELESVVSITEMCSIMTFITASVLGSVTARDKFVREHKHTKFTTKFRALRSYNDAIFLGGLKHGAIWALKSGVFTFTFMGTSQCISVYRNKTSPTDYIAGAALTGGLLRINLGLRGFIAGGIIGGVLGAVGGLAVYGLMVAGNETQEQRHYWKVYDKLYAKREAELLSAGARGESQDQVTNQVPS